MPWLDPDRVRRAAQRLRSVADEADDLQASIRAGLTLAQLEAGPSLVTCREIDEELGLLATLLTQRADMAENFVLRLAPAWAETTAAALYRSLLDDEGPIADLRGDLAIDVLLRHASFVAVEDEYSGVVDRYITDERLDEALADPNTPPELRAAIDSLRSEAGWAHRIKTEPGLTFFSPLFFLPEGVVSLGNLERLQRRNEILRVVQPAASAAFLDPTDSHFGDAELEGLSIDPAEFYSLGLSTDHGVLLAAMIEQGTFEHSSSRARDFIASLPIHVEDGAALDIREASTDALERLHTAATRDLGESDADFVTRLEVLMRLPESTDGFRNSHITRAYADIARREDIRLNGIAAGDPTQPGHTGANWFYFGVVASFSVGAAIRGEIETYGAAIPHPARQDVANGNQAIFSDFAQEYIRVMRGDTPKQPLLAEGFERMEMASDETDPKRKQELMLEADGLLAMHEQIVVDPYLQLENLATHHDVAALVFSSIGFDPRTTTQIMTDMGALEITDADGTPLAPSIEIGRTVEPIDDPHNLVTDADLCNGIGEPFCTNGTTADKWSEYAQRMPVIGDVMKFHLTDPALFAAAASYRPITRQPERR